MNRSFFLLLSMSLATIPAAAVSKIAVLDFQGSGLSPDPDTHIERLGQLTDAARSGAILAVKGRYNVLTKVNQEEVLAAQGFDPMTCIGECDVAIMRRMAVEFGVTGQVVAIATRWRITLQLYNVKSGVAMDTEVVNIEGSQPDEMLLDAMDRVGVATQAILKRALRLSGAAVTSIAEGTIGDPTGELNFGSSGRVQVTFASEPSGAVVLLDGDLLCNETPCTKLVAPGAHDLQMTKAEYHMERQPVDLTKGTGTVRWSLRPKFGTIDVVTDPPGLGISINGDPSHGQSPLRQLRLTAGPYRILVADRCFRELGEQILLQEGEHRTIRIDPPPKQIGLLVDAKDLKGDDAIVNVSVDGEARGNNADFIPTSVCAQQLRVTFPDGKVIDKALSIDGSKVHHRVTVSLLDEKVKETRLQVTSNVTGATVYVDGERAGVAPISMSILPGAHEVKVEHPGYDTHQTTVRAAAGDTATAWVELQETWNPFRSAPLTTTEWNFFSTPSSERVLRVPFPQRQTDTPKDGAFVMGLGMDFGLQINPYRVSEDIATPGFGGDLRLRPEFRIHPDLGILELDVMGTSDWTSLFGFESIELVNAGLLSGDLVTRASVNRLGRLALSAENVIGFSQNMGRVYRANGSTLPLGAWSNEDQLEEFHNTLDSRVTLTPGLGLSLEGGYQLDVRRYFPMRAISSFDNALDVFRVPSYFAAGHAESLQSLDPDGSIPVDNRYTEVFPALLDSLQHTGFTEISFRPLSEFQLHTRLGLGVFENVATTLTPLEAMAGLTFASDGFQASVQLGVDAPVEDLAPSCTGDWCWAVGDVHVGYVDDDLELNLWLRRKNVMVPLYAMQTVNDAELVVRLPMVQRISYAELYGRVAALQFGAPLEAENDAGIKSLPFPLSSPGSSQRMDLMGEAGVKLHGTLSTVTRLEALAAFEMYESPSRALSRLPGIEPTSINWLHFRFGMTLTTSFDVVEPDELREVGNTLDALMDALFG